MAKRNLENKHIRKPPKKRKGRHTKKINKHKTYKEYAGQGQSWSNDHARPTANCCRRWGQTARQTGR